MRTPLLAAALLALVLGGVAEAAQKKAEAPAGHDHKDGEAHDDGEGRIAMSEETIRASRIGVAMAASTPMAQTVSVPATIAANADRLAHVTARLSGTVREIRKRLGDTVAAGEVLALLESREIAEAKSEYLAAVRASQLAETTLTRERTLRDKGISAEQDFLQAQAAAEEARIRRELARQKLTALGLSDKEVSGLPGRNAASLRLQELRAPIGGRVIDRKAVLGALAAAEADLFVIADLSSVWAEMAIPVADLDSLREGQPVTVTLAGADEAGGEAGTGKLAFVSPVLDPETRSARAIAVIDNRSGGWRPGSYVTARIATSQQAAALAVPAEALQTVGKDKVVFVRTPEGFEQREVVPGRSNGRTVEIVSGLDPGERVATANSFLLKAQLGKAEAEHSH